MNPEISHLFQFHKLNSIGRDKATEIALAFTEFVTKLATINGGRGQPASRSWAIAMTHLEEAAFHVKKDMACMPEHQEEVPPSEVIDG